MIKTLIKSNPSYQRQPANDNSSILHVSELFYDTIQGEGVSAGAPSTFLRMKGCTLNCKWCDTNEVWRYGAKYTVNEIYDMFNNSGLLKKMNNEGQHLVLTGGSPLRQQKGLAELLEKINKDYKNIYVEVENEVTIKPDERFSKYISQWNNSPKLENSGMPIRSRYKKDLLKYMSSLDNSWFKFVVNSEDDYKEINENYIKPGLIKKNQILLMPEGASREELQKNYNTVVDLATKYGPRLTDRLQVSIWNKTTGV